jgi:hypothetical protein
MTKLVNQFLPSTESYKVAGNLKQAETVEGFVDELNNALVITKYNCGVDLIAEDAPIQLGMITDVTKEQASNYKTWYENAEDRLSEKFKQDSKDIINQYYKIPRNERYYKQDSYIPDDIINNLPDDVPGINNTKFKVTINKDDFMTGFKQFPQTEVQEQTITTTKSMNKIKLGQKVLVYPEPGVEPILAIVTAIDEITGLIVEVTFKDADKKDKILKVKTKIVTVLPTLYQFFKMIKSWFK